MVNIRYHNIKIINLWVTVLSAAVCTLRAYVQSMGKSIKAAFLIKVNIVQQSKLAADGGGVGTG